MQHLTNYAKCNGKNYYISTVRTADGKYETMIFPADKYDTVTDWEEVFCKHYRYENEAVENHKYIVNHIEEFVGEHSPEPEVSLKNEQKSEPEEEKTVRITSAQLQEALAEAFDKESKEFFKDDEVKAFLFSISFGTAVCSHVVGKLFGEEKEND
jgi:molybdopterin converting factor small subunit